MQDTSSSFSPHLQIRAGAGERDWEGGDEEETRLTSLFAISLFIVEPKDLGDLRFAYIQLTICKSRVKYGAPLG